MNENLENKKMDEQKFTSTPEPSQPINDYQELEQPNHFTSNSNNEPTLQSPSPPIESQQVPEPIQQPQPMQLSPQPVPQQVTIIQKNQLDMSFFFTLKMLTLGIVLGLLLMLIGIIIVNTSIISDENANLEDRADSLGHYKIGAVIYNIGIFAVGGALLLGGLLNNTLPKNIRAGMLIGAGLIISFGMIKNSWV